MPGGREQRRAVRGRRGTGRTGGRPPFGKRRLLEHRRPIAPVAGRRGSSGHRPRRPIGGRSPGGRSPGGRTPGGARPHSCPLLRRYEAAAR